MHLIYLRVSLYTMYLFSESVNIYKMFQREYFITDHVFRYKIMEIVIQIFENRPLLIWFPTIIRSPFIS